MENVKKTSRFGVRLSAIMVAVLLVVCMAVPAFAYGSYPVSYPAVPDDSKKWLLIGDELYDITDITSLKRSGTISNAWKWTFYSGSIATNVRWYSLSGGAWDSEGYTNKTGDGKSSISITWSNMDVSASPDSLTYTFTSPPPPPPPPPDPYEDFNSGLAVVLDWVGATVSALFSGELAGLLPLVAVPVAITLLLVAIIVIKRSIWGA